MVDYSIDCDSDDYQWLLLSCAALVVIWPLGLPATLFYSMWRDRTLIQEEDRDTLQKFDFALGDYKLSHWYWEVVRLLPLIRLEWFLRVGSRTRLAAHSTRAHTCLTVNNAAVLFLAPQPPEKSAPRVLGDVGRWSSHASWPCLA